MSETNKYRHLTVSYCKGNGIDIASGGDPVVPHAIQFELPEDDYVKYGNKPSKLIQWRGAQLNEMPFKDNVLDFVYSSHLIEDFPHDKWTDMFKEWRRVLKPGGHFICIVPEVTRWNFAINELGQPPNCIHAKPEPFVGEMSAVATAVGFQVVSEALTDCYPNDYSILGIFKK